MHARAESEATFYSTQEVTLDPDQLDSLKELDKKLERLYFLRELDKKLDQYTLEAQDLKTPFQEVKGKLDALGLEITNACHANLSLLAAPYTQELNYRRIRAFLLNIRHSFLHNHPSAPVFEMQNLILELQCQDLKKVDQLFINETFKLAKEFPNFNKIFNAMLQMFIEFKIAAYQQQDTIKNAQYNQEYAFILNQLKNPDLHAIKVTTDTPAERKLPEIKSERELTETQAKFIALCDLRINNCRDIFESTKSYNKASKIIIFSHDEIETKLVEYEKTIPDLYAEELWIRKIWLSLFQFFNMPIYEVLSENINILTNNNFKRGDRLIIAEVSKLVLDSNQSFAKELSAPIKAFISIKLNLYRQEKSKTIQEKAQTQEYIHEYSVILEQLNQKEKAENAIRDKMPELAKSASTYLLDHLEIERKSMDELKTVAQCEAAVDRLTKWEQKCRDDIKELSKKIKPVELVSTLLKILLLKTKIKYIGLELDTTRVNKQKEAVEIHNQLSQGSADIFLSHSYAIGTYPLFIKETWKLQLLHTQISPSPTTIKMISDVANHPGNLRNTSAEEIQKTIASINRQLFLLKSPRPYKVDNAIFKKFLATEDASLLISAIEGRASLLKDSASKKISYARDYSKLISFCLEENFPYKTCLALYARARTLVLEAKADYWSNAQETKRKLKDLYNQIRKKYPKNEVNLSEQKTSANTPTETKKSPEEKTSNPSWEECYATLKTKTSFLPILGEVEVEDRTDYINETLDYLNDLFKLFPLQEEILNNYFLITHSIIRFDTYVSPENYVRYFIKLSMFFEIFAKKKPLRDETLVFLNNTLDLIQKDFFSAEIQKETFELAKKHEHFKQASKNNPVIQWINKNLSPNTMRRKVNEEKNTPPPKIASPGPTPTADTSAEKAKKKKSKAKRKERKKAASIGAGMESTEAEQIDKEIPATPIISEPVMAAEPIKVETETQIPPSPLTNPPQEVVMQPSQAEQPKDTPVPLPVPPPDAVKQLSRKSKPHHTSAAKLKKLSEAKEKNEAASAATALQKSMKKNDAIAYALKKIKEQRQIHNLRSNEFENLATLKAEKAHAENELRKRRAAENKAAADRNKAFAEQIARERAAEKALQDKAIAEQAARERAAAEKALQDKAIAEKAARERAAAEKALQDRAIAEDAARENAAVEQALRYKAFVEHAAREKAAVEQALRYKAFVEHAAREKAAKEEAERASKEKATIQTQIISSFTGDQLIAMARAGQVPHLIQSPMHTPDVPVISSNVGAGATVRIDTSITKEKLAKAAQKISQGDDLPDQLSATLNKVSQHKGLIKDKLREQLFEVSRLLNELIEEDQTKTAEAKTATPPTETSFQAPPNPLRFFAQPTLPPTAPGQSSWWNAQHPMMPVMPQTAAAQPHYVSPAQPTYPYPPAQPAYAPGYYSPHLQQAPQQANLPQQMLFTHRQPVQTPAHHFQAGAGFNPTR